MTYLDYSATTPVNDEVLDSFNKACKNFPGNPNSLHKLGVQANQLINEATEQIASLINVKPSEIIYTSGSSESNNLAIKGIALKYKNRGKRIITTPLEHSSVYGPLNYLESLGFEIVYVKLKDDGKIDLDDLEKLINDETILVCVNAVNSEMGIIQPIDEIGLIIKKYPKCFFHVDITQAIGKINIDLTNVSLASFSAHKFYGLKGIGVLVKKEKITLEPLIHGGKSTTIYRSGTPALPLIVSLSKALRLVLNLNCYDYVANLNQDLRAFFANYALVKINSPKDALAHILNISVLGVKPESMLHALEEYDIYISTQSACSSPNTSSLAVYSVTKSKERAESSLRISLSHLTMTKDIAFFKEKFDVCYEKLTKLKDNSSQIFRLNAGL